MPDLRYLFMSSRSTQTPSDLIIGLELGSFLLRPLGYCGTLRRPHYRKLPCGWDMTLSCLQASTEVSLLVVYLNHLFCNGTIHTHKQLTTGESKLELSSHHWFRTVAMAPSNCPSLHTSTITRAAFLEGRRQRKAKNY